MDEDGELLEDGIKSLYREIPLPKYQRKVMNKSVTTCVAQVKENGLRNKEALIAFNKCLHREVAIACPKHKQDMSEGCVNLRMGKSNSKKAGESSEQ